MHLRSVERFVDIAQQRSFSKAATLHGVSQSAASQAVQALEKALGTELIDRSQRPLELTDAGRLYFEGCRDVLKRYRQVEDAVLRLQHRVVGSVRVAAIYSVGLLQMETYTERFERRYPDAKLEIAYLHPDEVYERLRDDRADLGLVSFPKHSGEFEAVPWQSQPMVVALAPKHRLADRESVCLKDLSGEAFVGFTQELTIGKEVDKALRKARVQVDMVSRFDNVETIKQAVRCGTGVSLLPRPTLREEVALGTLRAVPLDDVKLERPLGIVRLKHKSLSTAEQCLIDLLREDPTAAG